MAIDRGRPVPWGSTVANLTRRSFLQHTPVGAASFGLLPALPALATLGRSRQAAVPGAAATATGPIVIHVNDPAAGKMTLFAGTREIVLRDPEVVARFIETLG
jgi:hypothetical protein